MPKKKKTKTENTSFKKPGSEVFESLVESAKKDYSKYTAHKEFLENPNPILEKTKEGSMLGIELFREIATDYQAGSDLEARKLKAASFPWGIIVENGTESDNEQASLLEEQIRPIHDDLVTEVEDRMDIGFSVTELGLVYQDNRVEIPSIRGWKQEKFTFSKEWELMMLSETGNPFPVPNNRAICATYKKKKGNRYGRSILTDAFWPWYFKKHGWLFWATYIEKFGQPTVVGKYPPGTSEENKKKLLEACKAIQNDFAVRIPQNWIIELMEAKRAGTGDTYKDFITRCDMAISKVILLSTLTSNEAQFGTRAQAEVHQDLSDEGVESDVVSRESIFTNQLVKPLAEWNYKFTKPPKYVVHRETEDTSKEAAERDKTLSTIFPISLDQEYEKFNQQKPGENDLCSYNGKVGKFKDIIKTGLEEPPKANANMAFVEFSTTYIDEFDALILNENEAIEDMWVYNRGVFEKDLLKQLEKVFKGVESYPDALTALKQFKTKKSKDLWEKLLKVSALMGEYSFHRQAKIANQSADFADFAEEFIIDNEFRFGKPEDAIRYFKRKLPIPKEVWNQIEKDVREFAFYVSELEDTGLINFVKEKMLEALEQGKTFQQFRKEASGTNQFFGYMKTSFTTNMMNALSYQNGVALLRNVDRFPYWRYSAVLDGKTRESHAAMHGYVARYDHPIWNTWYPPNGFNCRCRITIAQKWLHDRIQGDEDLKKSIMSLNPDQGFESSPLNDLRGNFLKILKNKKDYSLNLNHEIRGLLGAA